MAALGPGPVARRRAATGDFGRLGDYPETVAAFGKPDGKPWHAGDRLVQADLAATLDRIAAGGADEFYTGRTAELIARYMEEHGGFITRDDLKSYEAKVRPPVHTTFRGFDVYGAGPPSSGRRDLCLMLNILERYDLKADGRDSPRTLHRVAEAMRRAFFVRATQLADPDFVPVPVAELTSKILCRRTGPIDRRAGHPQRRAGPVPDPEGRGRPHDPPFHHRRGRRRRGDDLHPGGLVRRQVRGRRGGLPAQQRDGRLQPDPGPDRHPRLDRHPGQPDRAPQADAQLAGPDARA